MEALEYITFKAMLQCEQGSVPALFTPTYNQTTKINGCLVSTKADRLPLANVPTFVICKKTKKPCMPVPTEWQDSYPVKVKGQPTLIGKSCNNCAIGGKISFLTSGQVPLTQEEEGALEGMREDVQNAYDAEQKEKNKSWWQKAGEFVVDCVPVVGPIVSLVKNVGEGNLGMAGMDIGFLALDVVGLATAPFTGGASVAGATAVKVGARQAIKAGAKQVAKKLSKEALEAVAKQTGEMLSKLSVRSLTSGKLCVFACFPAGTPVATACGLKNIEDIQAGDEVWSYKVLTGEVGLKSVISIYESTADLLVMIELDGEIIAATPEHPFYANGEWKEAGLLEAGDSIKLFSGRLAKVAAVKYAGAAVPAELPGNVITQSEAIYEKGSTVFNLEVEGWHTYFVGRLHLLVHNTGGVCLKQVLKQIKDGKKRLRTLLLGKTPGKGSKTGREVIERMKKDGRIKTVRGETMFKATDNKWYPLKEADMSHKTDAVKWWNDTGKHYGAKSDEVRKWMRDADNYELDHFKLNRSAGAKLPDRYNMPTK